MKVIVIPSYRHNHLHSAMSLHSLNERAGHSHVLNNLKLLILSLNSNNNLYLHFILPNTTTNWEYVEYISEARGLASCAVRQVVIADDNKIISIFDEMNIFINNEIQEKNRCTLSMLSKHIGIR